MSNVVGAPALSPCVPNEIRDGGDTWIAVYEGSADP